MNKFILALALVLAPFFSVKADMWTDGTVDLKEAQMEEVWSATCSASTESIGIGDVGGLPISSQIRGVCGPKLAPIIEASLMEDVTGDFEYQVEYVSPSIIASKTHPDLAKPVERRSYSIYISEKLESVAYTCPPEQHPNYSAPKMIGNDNFCYDPEQVNDECPSGFLKNKIKDECVPIDCPSKGQSDTIFASGSAYTGSAGTYCDGSCAFTASGGQNESGYTGSIGLNVVSTGAQCGQDTSILDNHSFVEGDTDSTCTSSETSNGRPFLSCTNGDPDPENPDPNEPNPDEPDNSDLKDDDISEVDPTTEDCDVNDTACEMRNMQEKLDAENLELKTEQQEQHNKLIDSQERSTKELVKAIDGFREINSVGQKKIADAVIAGSGTGSGTGSGGGVGGGVGGDEDGEGTEKTRNTEPSEGLEGFYESEYEDGFEGMFSEKMAEYKETEFFAFLEQFKPSFGGSAPNMSFCMNFGSYMNLGCFSLNLDPRIFPALKIFILITAGFTCRKIIFGG